MNCSVCDKKNDLHQKSSKLMPKVDIYVCAPCEQKHLEPRWIVLLIARTQGIQGVKDYLIKHQYYGDEITAKELL